MIVNRYLNIKLGLVLLFSTSVNNLLIYSAGCCKCCKGNSTDGNGNGNGVQKGGNPSRGKPGGGKPGGGKSGTGLGGKPVTEIVTELKKELVITIDGDGNNITDIALNGKTIEKDNWNVDLENVKGIVHENLKDYASVVKIEQDIFEYITTDFNNLEVNINDETIDKYLCAVVKNKDGSCYIVFSTVITITVKEDSGLFTHGLFRSSTNSSIYILRNQGLESLFALFALCTNLTKLDLSKLDTSQVTNMSKMFFGCSKLEDLNLSNFNTEKVTNMSSMFFGCSKLKELNLASFNTKGVNKMADMFYACPSLNKIIVNKNNNNNNLKETIVKSGFKEQPGLGDGTTTIYVRQETK